MRTLVLDTVNKSLVAWISTAASFAEPDFTVHYADTNGTTFTEGSQDGVLNGSNLVTICDPPATGYRRVIKSITINNVDIDLVELYVQFVNGANARMIWHGILSVADVWTLEGTYDSAGAYKGTGGGGGGGAASAIFDVTHAQLLAQMSALSLAPASYYRITDFRTRHLIPNTTDHREGQIEPLIVMAISTSEIGPTAWSASYPQDYIKYVPTDIWTIDADWGTIIYREDLIQGLAAHEDWRATNYRRWEDSIGSGQYVSVDPVIGAASIDRYIFESRSPNNIRFTNVKLPAVNPDFGSGIYLCNNVFFTSANNLEFKGDTVENTLDGCGYSTFIDSCYRVRNYTAGGITHSTLASMQDVLITNMISNSFFLGHYNSVAFTGNADGILTYQSFQSAVIDISLFDTEMFNITTGHNHDGINSRFLNTLHTHTHAEILTLVGNSALVPGDVYLVSDFATVHAIPGTAAVNTGPTEQIILMAASHNAFYNEAHSVDFPNDILLYELVDSSGQGGTYGRIYYRKDPELNVQVWEDWRATKYRRWETSVGSGVYTSVTDPGHGEAYRDRLIFSNSRTPTSTQASNFIIKEQARSYPYCNNVFEANVSWIIADSAFTENTSLQAISDTTFGDRCHTNVFDCANFQANWIGPAFYDNRIHGSSFVANIIARQFYDNQFDSSCTFGSNACDFDWCHNTVEHDAIVSDNFFHSSFIYSIITAGFEISSSIFNHCSAVRVATFIRRCYFSSIINMQFFAGGLSDCSVQIDLDGFNVLSFPYNPALAESFPMGDQAGYAAWKSTFEGIMDIDVSVSLQNYYRCGVLFLHYSSPTSLSSLGYYTPTGITDIIIPRKLMCDPRVPQVVVIGTEFDNVNADDVFLLAGQVTLFSKTGDWIEFERTTITNGNGTFDIWKESARSIYG